MTEKSKKGKLSLEILIAIIVWVGIAIGCAFVFTKEGSGVEKENERISISDDVQFGTIKAIEKIQINDSSIYEYIGYDVETMCMYYVFCTPGRADIRMTPYCAKGEDGNAHQAIFGVDYKE